MKQEDYDKLLIKWVKNHYWDSLEKDKDLILRHLRTFTGDTAQQAVEANTENRCFFCNTLTQATKKGQSCPICGGRPA